MIVFDKADPIEPPAPVTKTVLPGIVLFIDAHVRVKRFEDLESLPSDTIPIPLCNYMDSEDSEATATSLANAT